MLMQHVGVGYFGYYRATAYVMKHSLMPEIAKLRMKALNFWDKHGIRAAADAFWRINTNALLVAPVASHRWSSGAYSKKQSPPGSPFKALAP